MFENLKKKRKKKTGNRTLFIDNCYRHQQLRFQSLNDRKNLKLTQIFIQNSLFLVLQFICTKSMSFIVSTFSSCAAFKTHLNYFI